MLQSTTAKPVERFGQYFQIAPALCEASRNEAHFIRHDVYARDLGYEPVRADQRETDPYDAHALQCVVRTAEAAPRPVACARLIFTNPGDREAPLPFEKACLHTLDRSIIDPARLPRHQIAEVSRLAVMGEFRRRKGERTEAVSLTPADIGGPKVPRFPNIPLSLYMASLFLAQREGIEYLFTLTEPRLAKHFEVLGVKTTPIGAPVDHRGLRVPSLIRIGGVYAGMRAMARQVWDEVEAQIETAYAMDAMRSPAPVAASEQDAPVSMFGAMA